jgi:hypothetical protein
MANEYLANYMKKLQVACFTESKERFTEILADAFFEACLARDLDTVKTLTSYEQLRESPALIKYIKSLIHSIGITDPKHANSLKILEHVLSYQEIRKKITHDFFGPLNDIESTKQLLQLASVQASLPLCAKEIILGNLILAVTDNDAPPIRQFQSTKTLDIKYDNGMTTEAYDELYEKKRKDRPEVIQSFLDAAQALEKERIENEKQALNDSIEQVLKDHCIKLRIITQNIFDKKLRNHLLDALPTHFKEMMDDTKEIIHKAKDINSTLYTALMDRALSRTKQFIQQSPMSVPEKIIRILADVLMLIFLPLGIAAALIKKQLTGGASFYFFPPSRPSLKELALDFDQTYISFRPQ